MKFVYGMCIGNFPDATTFKSARAFDVPLNTGDTIQDGDKLVTVKNFLHANDGVTYAFCEIIN